MKSRVPIPLRKLIEDKQSVKNKKQQTELKQSGNPNSSNTNNQNQKPFQAQNRSKDSKNHQTKLISSDLQFNLDHIKKTLGNSSDIVIRDFQAGKNGEIKLGIVYTDGLTYSLSAQFVPDPRTPSGQEYAKYAKNYNYDFSRQLNVAVYNAMKEQGNSPYGTISLYPQNQNLLERLWEPLL